MTIKSKDHYDVDPNDPIPFRILAEYKLNEVGWDKPHTNLVASLLQKLYHTCPSTKIDIDEFWGNYIMQVDEELEKRRAHEA